ncbi:MULTISPECIES: FkbM family methyltransferase [unclassified Streptomyces]|uniref:FkbM family methyltransferase n=1 Tax=unclassified Streptomyces TaxID=2593676 RepID=UPI00278BB262|nr:MULTISPECIES: FkbM family methyltransferase [unclassified Streptomyces]
MPTVHRTLLKALARTGTQVLDLAPGAAVLARGRRQWVATPLAKSAHLVLDPERSRTQEHGFQKAAADYLGARHVAAMLEHYRVNCVFDVGANVGQYGRRLREFGYGGRIVSFEPVPGFVKRLRRHAENDPDWQVIPCGLGRVDTVQPMHVDWQTLSSLLPPSDYGNARYQRFTKGATEEIRVCRLDGLMDRALDGIRDPRPYLKMDTQGYDLEVFAGAGERIAEFVGMQSEVALLRIYEGSPRMDEALAAYERGGFEVTGMYPVTREKSTGRVLEFDCVLMRAAAGPGSGG